MTARARAKFVSKFLDFSADSTSLLLLCFV